MTNEGKASTAVLVIGLALLVGSVFADQIGIGHEPGLGSYQVVGIVLGVIATAFGAYLIRRGRSPLTG